MRFAAFFGILIWFGASVSAGYRLTERSFSWLSEPEFGAAQKNAPPGAAFPNLDDVKIQLPPKILEQAKTLSPQQMLCLQSSIKPARIQAVLAGQATAEEAAAIQTCLK